MPGWTRCRDVSWGTDSDRVPDLRVPIQFSFFLYSANNAFHISLLALGWHSDKKIKTSSDLFRTYKELLVNNWYLTTVLRVTACTVCDLHFISLPPLSKLLPVNFLFLTKNWIKFNFNAITSLLSQQCVYSHTSTLLDYFHFHTSAQH